MSSHAERVWVLAVAAALAATPGQSCGPAPPRGQTVDVADETAVIVWDAATSTQHFVRRASFRTGAKDFGFLVPTPTRPTLAEADDGAFKLLAKVTAPPPAPAAPRASGPGCGCGGGGPTASAPVRVLEEATVAGYDAAVLEADDVAALGDWLAARGYDDSPRIRDWLTPYVAEHWTVTAFKIAKPDPAAPTAATAAVRMSFRTDKPFFPYREPAANTPALNSPPALYHPPERLLRVYFIGTSRTDGTVGVGPPVFPDPQEGRMKVRWANRLPADVGPELAGLLRLPAGLPADAYLTELEMPHLSRAGYGDVWFVPSADRGPKNRGMIEKWASRPNAATGCAACYALTACLGVMGLRRLLRLV